MLRSAVTPSIRSRKKRGVHDDSDDTSDELPSAAAKRRRTDRSPVSKGRRNPPRRSTVEGAAQAEQVSDHEVRDTIMVGVSMNAPASEDQSSFHEESELTCSGSDEKKAQSALKPPELAELGESHEERMQSVEKDLAEDVVPEEVVKTEQVDEAEESDILQLPRLEDAGRGEEKPSIGDNEGQDSRVPRASSSKLAIHNGQMTTLAGRQRNSPPRPSNAALAKKHDGRHNSLETGTDQPIDNSLPAEQSPASSPEPIVSIEPRTPLLTIEPVSSTYDPRELDVTAQDILSPVSISEDMLQSGHSENQSLRNQRRFSAHVSEKLAQILARSSATTRITKVKKTPATKPSRLSSAIPIYRSALEERARTELTPYEEQEADVAYPSAWTEAINIADTAQPSPAPTLTPSIMSTSTPHEVVWDGHTPLTARLLSALHRQELVRRRQEERPPISLRDFYNECCRRYKAIKASLEAASLASSSTKPEPKPKSAVPKRRGPHRTAAAPSKLAISEQAKEDTPAVSAQVHETPCEGTPQNSQALESQVPTAAPSPQNIAEVPGVTGGEDIPGLQLEEVSDKQQENTVVAHEAAQDSTSRLVEPIEVTRVPRKQYLFPRIRDPAEFTGRLENHEVLGTEELYSRLAEAVGALHTWQREYGELKKIVDDEDNAKRRQANDKALSNWEARQKNDDDEDGQWRRHFDDPVKGPAPFELRGVRAPKPYVDDPVLERQKENDRIQAQAWGFRYNDHPKLVGRQNPEEQRWEAPETRLRDRKQTQRAADLAEENVVEGKRTRRPRVLSDQSRDPSRAGTPAPPAPPAPSRRRRNAGHATASDGLDEEYEDENDIPAPAGGVPEGVKKRLGVSRTRLGQGQNQVTSAPVQREDIEQGEEDTDEPVSGRKRRRGAALSKAPDRDAQDEMDDEEGAKEMPKAKRQRLTRMQAAALSKSSAKLGEITPGVFYKEAAAAAEEAAESRPPTPSSDNDAQMGENAESAYGLREKKKRNFAAENDPELETRAKKRARVSAQAASVPRERTPAGPAGPTKRQKQRIPFKRPDVGGDSRKVPPPPSLTSGLAASANVNNAGPIPAMGVPLAPAPPVPQAPYIHTFRANPSSASKASASGATPPAGTARYPKKTPKIKLVGNGAASGASSRSQTPIAGTQGPPPAAGSADDKPYNEMSKSEKMSASMKSKHIPSRSPST